jgi:hypothetical protein
MAEISEQVGNLELRALAKSGLLLAQGETRGRYYVAAPTVRDVYSKHYEQKTYEDPFSQMTLPLVEARPTS